VVERFANGVVLLQDTCPGLVEQIERGNLEGSETRMILSHALQPMLERGIDTVVLGCTHYPFVIPVIEDICGPAVRVIDPAPAVARQVRRVLEMTGVKLAVGSYAQATYFTSGEPSSFGNLLTRLIGDETMPGGFAWDRGEREIKPP
jgi:glutamate racemase